jgi:hypothetical protein
MLTNPSAAGVSRRPTGLHQGLAVWDFSQGFDAAGENFASPSKA